MKKINEMTEQEILALTEEDVQRMIKFSMMENGIKIIEKPKEPDLFEISPADTQCYSIPILDGYAFTDIEEAKAVAEALQNAVSLRKVEYDWNKLGSDYKYLTKKERYSYKGESDFVMMSLWIYSKELYAKITDNAFQNKLAKERYEKEKREYEDNLKESSGIIQEIRERVSEVQYKYKRLESITYKFAADYYPLSDDNEKMAIKFLDKAYSLSEDEKEYVLTNYRQYLSK